MTAKQNEQTTKATIPTAKINAQILPEHTAIALNYLRLKVTEKPLGSNRGKYIDDWTAPFRMGAIPWCAASMTAWSEAGNVSTPKVHSPAAIAFKCGRVHSINDVYYRRYTPKAGDYRVKHRSGGNHVDMVVAWDVKTNSGLLIGGNVSDRVKLRKVTIKSMIADGTIGITEVTGNYDYVIDNTEWKNFVKYYENVQFK